MTASRKGSLPIDAFKRIARLAVLAVAGAALLQCTSAPPAVTAPPTTVGSPPPSAPAPAPAGPPVPGAPPVPAPATVQTVTAADLGATWRPGCPVEPSRLRRVEVSHIGFDGEIHRGELIVNEDLASEVVAIFEQLLRLGYPIEKMRNVDAYPGAEDELSMADNNTSAFNCRDIPGTGRWSEHAYGRAIDINPLVNPYIDGTGAIQPHNAGAYVDRARTDPGLLHSGDAAVQAFIDRGWSWGGYWRSPIDYQHFERP